MAGKMEMAKEIKMGKEMPRELRKRDKGMYRRMKDRFPAPIFQQNDACVNGQCGPNLQRE
jgi:hypothetical protein